MKKFILFILAFLFTSNVNAASGNYVDYLTGNIVSNNYNRTQARYLQKELNMVMNCELDTDGIIGVLTKNCIRAFQQKYHLEVDGLVGPITRKKLNQLYSQNKGIVTTETLRVRERPGTNSRIVGRVHQGNILTIYGSTKHIRTIWYDIEYYDRENDTIISGYVSSDYVATTFAEIDIVSQTLRLYKNSNLYLDTPITTGKADGKHDTHKGFFHVFNKEQNRRLKPSNAYVRYWMPFDYNGPIGIHDADWRGTNVNFDYFGGTIYKNMNAEAGSRYSGSHGCVNTPVPKMPIIYNTLNIESVVYVH